MLALVEQKERTAIARVTSDTDKVLQIMIRQAFTGNGQLSRGTLEFKVQGGVDLTFGVDLLAEQSGEVETWETGPGGLVKVEEPEDEETVVKEGRGDEKLPVSVGGRVER